MTRPRSHSYRVARPQPGPSETSCSTQTLPLPNAEPSSSFDRLCIAPSPMASHDSSEKARGCESGQSPGTFHCISKPAVQLAQPALPPPPQAPPRPKARMGSAASLTGQAVLIDRTLPPLSDLLLVYPRQGGLRAALCPWLCILVATFRVREKSLCFSCAFGARPLLP